MRDDNISLEYKSRSVNTRIQTTATDKVTPANTLQANLSESDIASQLGNECFRNESNVLEINKDLNQNIIVIPLQRVAAYDLESFASIHNVNFDFFIGESPTIPGDDADVEFIETRQVDRVNAQNLDVQTTTFLATGDMIFSYPEGTYFRITSSPFTEYVGEIVQVVKETPFMFPNVPLVRVATSDTWTSSVDGYEFESLELDDTGVIYGAGFTYYYDAISGEISLVTDTTQITDNQGTVYDAEYYT